MRTEKFQVEAEIYIRDIRAISWQDSTNNVSAADFW